MSDYNNSLYENSEYPSRRRAPERERQPAGTSRKRRKKKGGIGRIIGIFFKVLGTLILIGLCTGALLCCFAAVYINEVIVPIADLSMDDFPLGENSIMYYQDKATGEYKEMTTLLNVTSQIWVDYEDMPKYLIDATVAIEDKRFWEHPGVDWKGTAKAVLRMFTGGEISGGSTITQQLIKNTTQYNETTVKRKITEIIRALRFTQNNSKEFTLERYLNIIPLGSKFEGVGSAALGYFGKPVSELTLAECASLIGITNNPSKYGPYSFARSQGKNTDEIWDARQWNKYRQEVILYEMLDQGKITQAEYDEAVAQELVFVRGEGEQSDTHIYNWYEETVISDVRQALINGRGWSEAVANQALQSGGLRIYTCYDPTAQALAEQVYTDRSNLNYTSKDGQLLQSAICVIDNTSGDVVAIVGRFGEKTVNLGGNYANDGHRQPGSSFKPLAVYSPALEMGKISPCSVIDDYPYQVLNGRAYPLNGGYASYHGRVTVRQALKESLNTVAVRIFMEFNGGITPEESFKFVQERYHIDLEEGRMVNGEMKTDITLSLSMGGLTDGVNVRDMAEAYTTFPNNGSYLGSRTFTKVTQMVNGQEVLLLDNTLTPQPVIKPTTAYYMNDMLQGVFDAGGTAAGRGGSLKRYHVAGKTGTTNNDHDRWFVGYTPYYTAAVWTGYERGTPITGAPFNVSLDLWEKVMVPLHEGLADADYPKPAEMRSIIYCKDSGLIATEYCAMDPRGDRRASDTIFPEDYPTDKRCTFHTEASVVTICVDSPVTKEDGAQTGLYHLAGEFCPEESKRDICLPDYERERVGNATAGDEAWRYASAASHGGCTVHLEAPPPEEPDVTDPNNPVDPSNPSNPGGATNPSDPNYNPYDPYYNPGGTRDPAAQDPELPSQPDVPIDPLPPNNSMVG
ncbi:MAG: transglycosylase [Lawsonibacter sp.]|nr:transglycosylase [Lawsonibacter sp.]